MLDRGPATLTTTARNGEIVVTLKGGPLPEPITHCVPVKDRRAWRELAHRLHERFGISLGDTLNTLQEALNEAKAKERDALAAVPVEPTPGDAPADSRSPKTVGDDRPPQGQPAGEPVTELVEAASWIPFPLESLPETVQHVVKDVSDSTNTDPAMGAVFALGILAGAIGNSRVAQLKPGWLEPSVLWIGVIAPSGSGKTPVLNALIGPIEDAEREMATQNKQRIRDHEAAVLKYETELREWKSDPTGEPPEKPEPPMQPRLLTTDSTLEAIGRLLHDSPRGLIMKSEELSQWLDIDRYKKTSSDAAGWCQCFDGRMLIVDRIGRDRLTIPRAAVSVVGGIQPEVFRQFAGNVFALEGGMLPRMLFVAPPFFPQQWNKTGLTEETRRKWEKLIKGLLTLEMAEGPKDPEPKVLELTPQAESIFGGWFNKLSDAIHKDDALRPWLSKLRAITARIALVLHLTRWVEGSETNAGAITALSMETAVAIAEWWAYELKRCLDPLLGDESQAIEATVLDWVRRRGGVVTIAELARSGPRRFRNKPDEAEAVLSKLARLGHGTLEIAQSSQKGGRPKSVFRLVDTGYVDTKLHKTAVLRGFVSISNVSKPETEGFTDNTPNPTPPESGGTDSGDSGQHQSPVVDIGELNRRLAEAAEAGGDAWVDFA